MKTKQRLVLVLSLLISSYGFSQQFPGCADVWAGTDITLEEEECTDVVLTAEAFEVGSTETYEVLPLQHEPPISYTEPGGIAVSVGTDDVWSPQIQLPFEFCFFGESYTSAKIGSNGAIWLGEYQGTSHPWSFSQQVPFQSPQAGQILGLYHDINPNVSGSVKYYLLGEAPCRVMVVVFNNLGHFSCTSMRSTFMMVLYETTNVIDVYVQRKDLCSSWNSGNAVIGIQNRDGTVGYTPPGRNTGQWTVDQNAPEAWRFQPNGTALPYTIEWLEGNTVIATGNTVNVAPSVATTYTARATYTSCNGVDQIIVEDDILVTPTVPNPMIIETAHENASCHGLSDGSITVSVTDGEEPYEYYLNDGDPQTSNVFDNLPAGTHTVGVIAADGCKKHVWVEVTEPKTIGLEGTVTNVTCHGYDDGIIELTQDGGTPDYSYSLNGGISQENPVFTDLGPGTHTIIVTDGNGCNDTIIKTITEPNAPNSGIITTETEYCATGTTTIETTGVSNGSFSATPNGLVISSISGLINLSASTPGTYDVIYSFTEGGCAYKDTLTITIIGTEGLNVPDHIYLCEGESWTPNAQTDGSVTWSDGLTNGVTVAGPAVGTSHTYYFTADINGCIVEDSVIVSTHAYPNVSFTASPDEGIPALDVEFTNTSSGDANFEWFFGDGESLQDNSTTVYHTFDEAGLYNTILVGTNEYGCSDTATVAINVFYPDMEYDFPNVFTPNGDGTNDYFQILHYSNIETFEIVILNRWGNVVFESDELDFKWNGKIKNLGAFCEHGVYFYKATFKNPQGDEEIAHGYIHLN